MKNFMLYAVAAITLSLCTMTAARAESAPAEASAEVKAATSIEARQPLGEGTEFKKGEKIYIWSQIKGAEGSTVEHVWKRDGKEVFRAKLEIQSKNWRTNSRMQSAMPGSYVVDVMNGDKSLGSVSFKVE